MHMDCDAGKYSGESFGQQGDKSSNPKGNQPWIFIGRTDSEAPVFWTSDAKSGHIGKDMT